MKFYSDMQFLLAMQTEASHLADQQKHTIKTRRQREPGRKRETEIDKETRPGHTEKK